MVYTYPLFKDKQWLIDFYINSDLSVDELCIIANCNIKYIYKYVNKYNIPKRNDPNNPFKRVRPQKPREKKPIKYKGLLCEDKDWLLSRYENPKLTQKDIATESNCSIGNISKWAKIHGLPPRITYMSSMVKIRYEDPIYCEKQRNATIKVTSNPEIKKKHDESVKRSWEGDENRRKYLSDLNKKRWQDPEYRKFAIERNLESIKDRKVYHLFGSANHNWRGGLSYDPYCYRFNKEFKQWVRNKFNNKCFLCGKSETKNNKKGLSVHHIDYNKNSICNGKEWAFVPLCCVCHSKTNGNRWYWFNLLINYWLDNPEIHLNTLDGVLTIK